MKLSKFGTSIFAFSKRLFVADKSSGNNSHTHRLSKDSFYSLCIQVGSVGLVFLSNIIIARLVGPEEYGIYNYAFTVIMLLSVISTSGFVSLLIRECAVYISIPKYDLIKGIVQWARIRVLLLNVLVIIFLAVALYFLTTFSFYEKTTMLLAAIAIPLLSLVTINQNTLNGAHFIIQSQVGEKIVKPIVLIFFIVLSNLLLPSGLTAISAILCNVLSFGAALIVTTFLMNKLIYAPASTYKPAFEAIKWKAGFFYLFALSILYNVNTRIDILLLGYLGNKTQVGIYSVASRIAEIVAFSLFVINIALAPIISSLYNRGELANLQKAVTKATRIALLIATPLVLIIIFLGKPLLSLFGNEFMAGYYALVILAFSQLYAVLAGSAGYLLTMTGNEKPAVHAMILSIITNITLNVLLIPQYGIEGAAIASGTSIVVWNSYMLVAAKIKTKINSTFIG